MPRRDGADLRPVLGEPPGAVHPGRLRGGQLPLLRRRRRAASTSTGMLADLRGGRARHDRRAARLLPQPDRLRPDRAPSGRRSPTSSSSAASCRSSTWPTRASPTGLEPDGAVVRAVRRARRPGAGRVLVQQELQPVRRAGRRPERGRAPTPRRPRGCCRSSRSTIRTTYSSPPTHGAAVVADGARRRRAAGAVGGRAGGDAAADQGDARARWSTALAAAGVQRDFGFIADQVGHVQLLRPDRRADASTCARPTGCTAPTPAGSASPRSTRQRRPRRQGDRGRPLTPRVAESTVSWHRRPDNGSGVREPGGPRLARLRQE